MPGQYRELVGDQPPADPRREQHDRCVGNGNRPVAQMHPRAWLVSTCCRETVTGVTVTAAPRANTGSVAGPTECVCAHETLALRARPYRSAPPRPDHAPTSA